MRQYYFAFFQSNQIIDLKSFLFFDSDLDILDVGAMLAEDLYMHLYYI